ncbi:PQQ-binding-like beta-propeller repeat protein [Fuerstiella marisgermanici]|uniref:Outer membrane biogenesis protein n=1 Tax=Fuerstiella marisgermanici TaxID=1891926 RepID=A0A1P8WMD0_9PLAN|nr:PQQ-binding-like beta-propeller repeat protein [Fuerstiella marisgermanici]APZ95210.1 outer membrane biogenesis protein [Fuerstiella marisgermanici]
MKYSMWAFLLLVSATWRTGVVADDNWPQFRGHNGLGLSDGNPPLTWDVSEGTNVEWKTPIAGLGHSSPIVWGDKSFLTTAVNSETEKPSLKTGWLGGAGESAPDKGQWSWQVLCLNLRTGRIVWTKDALVGEPAVKRHMKASHANCTPATDGQHVVAFFGSEGLFCYDVDGNLKWQKSFGVLRSGPYDDKKLEWGFASSPIMSDGHVLVQCDCLNTAFVAILDVQTGEEIRRIEREGEVATWSTPAVILHDGRRQIVCNGYKQMAGYDYETGERLWHLNGGGDIPVPMPLFADGLIHLTNGHGKSPSYAIKPSATGNITPSKNGTKKDGLAWWESTDGAYMPTPLIHGELIYTCNDNGRLAVRDAATGSLIYRQRVGTGSRTYSASAVATASHVYFASERGEITTIEVGQKFRKVSRNEMGEVVMATPAISGDRLLIRTTDALFSIKTPEPLPAFPTLP